jgi:hypothetical protein
MGGGITGLIYVHSENQHLVSDYSREIAQSATSRGGGVTDWPMALLV